MQLLIGHGQVPTIMPEASKLYNIKVKDNQYKEQMHDGQEKDKCNTNCVFTITRIVS